MDRNRWIGWRMPPLIGPIASGGKMAPHNDNCQKRHIPCHHVTISARGIPMLASMSPRLEIIKGTSHGSTDTDGQVHTIHAQVTLFKKYHRRTGCNKDDITVTQP